MEGERERERTCQERLLWSTVTRTFVWEGTNSVFHRRRGHLWKWYQSTFWVSVPVGRFDVNLKNGCLSHFIIKKFFTTEFGDP